jgi:hypothetical protein
VCKDPIPHSPARIGILLWAWLHGTRGKGRKMLPHERKLLTDQQLRDASMHQIEDLVQRINLMLQGRGELGQLVWHRTPEDQSEKDSLGRSDPFDPPTI